MKRFHQHFHFPALEAVQQALAAVPRVWQVEVWLATTFEEAYQQMRQPKACFEEANGGVLFRVDMEDLPWMDRLLAGLGVPFICPDGVKSTKRSRLSITCPLSCWLMKITRSLKRMAYSDRSHLWARSIWASSARTS